MSFPLAVLEAVYHHIGVEWWDGHDPEHIAPCDDMIAFDRRIGMPGLHAVAPRVQSKPRPTILPPDLFARFEKDAFWHVGLPHGVTLI